MTKTEYKISFSEINPSKKVTAIVLAGGRGTRMGEDKQLIKLAGIPVIIRSISAFSNCDFVDNIVVVANDGNMEEIQKLISEYNLQKVTDITLGGECREASVLEGVKRAADSDILLIHDGARPFVSREVIERVKNAAEMYGAAIPAVMLKDTVKKIGLDGEVISTPERNALRAVQTPQGFRAEIFNAAAKKFSDRFDTVTDDSGLIELSGGMVYTVDGDYRNIKITTREDLTLAESMISGGGKMRIGHGYDVHKFSPERKLFLGGVEIPSDMGLLGHSDADVLIHAICDALLGAAALGDIGKHFPDTDPKYKNIDSKILLKDVAEKILISGYKIVNIDATVIAQKPKIGAFIDEMCSTLADILGISKTDINIKATTEEGLGFTGRLEGISAHAVCIIEKE